MVSASGGLKPWQAALGNQISLQKLCDHETHALVNHKLGNDQQRQRHQKANMHVNVHQEGHGHAPAQRVSFQSREHQERQPGQQRDHEDALLQ